MKEDHKPLHLFCALCWKKGKKPSCNDKKCCLCGLYERKEKPTLSDIIETCCVKRCMHDDHYHEKICPISLLGVNKEYPLNPKIKEILKEWKEKTQLSE
jgi:hypothetical protein